MKDFRRQSFILVFVLIFTAVAEAAVKGKNVLSRHDVQNPKRQAFLNYDRKAFLFSVGYDLRFERNQDQQIAPIGQMNLAVGFETAPWVTWFEYSQYKEDSGTGSLSVSRQVESAFAWLNWGASDLDLISPFIGGGVGGLKTTVNTKIDADQVKDSSQWEPAFAASLGLRFFARSRFWLSAEGRMYKNSKQDPDPMLGALTRLGFSF